MISDSLHIYICFFDLISTNMKIIDWRFRSLLVIFSIGCSFLLTSYLDRHSYFTSRLKFSISLIYCVIDYFNKNFLNFYSNYNNSNNMSGSSAILNASCVFCRIIKSEIPCHKILETDFTLAFLDINPLSRGHVLIVPKTHGPMLHDIPDEYLKDTLVNAKKIIQSQISLSKGQLAYNLLQNNGRLAHQEVDHVHFHLIPKPNAEEGLGIRWPAKATDHVEFKKLAEEIKEHLQKS